MATLTETPGVQQAPRATTPVQEPGAADTVLATFWALPAAEILTRLNTRNTGLSQNEAQKIGQKVGLNLIKPKDGSSVVGLFASQFKSPISLMLIGAAVLSFFLRDVTDGIIILTIILISGLLSFWQERTASKAIEQLQGVVVAKTTVLRDGKEQDLPDRQLVPGDVLTLRSGDLVPADCYLLTANELFVNEATLTGETFPVDKMPGPVDADTSLAQRRNVLFMGASVVSGSGTAVIVYTGLNTELGHIAERINSAPPETNFEHGIRRFGYLLMEITLVLVFLIFAINVFLHKPVLDAFLFSLAIAVGLTPQLLPAIISINLAKGASRMAKQQVIVKRLSSIENLGSMNVLCSDKTGTLTDGVVTIDCIMDVNGQVSPRIGLLARINAQLQQGFRNPIDVAIIGAVPDDVSAYPRVDETPYDFIRKRLTILTEEGGQTLMITKGALQTILDVCEFVDTGGSAPEAITGHLTAIQQIFQEQSTKGFRTLGLATKNTNGKRIIDKTDEAGMTFLGFISLFDSPKAGIHDTLEMLQKLGIQIKMITGDNVLVATAVARSIGIDSPEVLTGNSLRNLNVEALRHKVTTTHVFAEIEPIQKELIILALKKAGYVVGYMGDGINDASALHAADVGISVDSAVNVAKESADIVLLKQDLNVLIDGVREGRRTFTNTMKYIFMATSANFGNMFSMAGASIFLPFLPLLPVQILLTNLLTDLPAMTIASDNVDPTAVEKPANWNLPFIRRFMLTFGLLSSVFDYLSFGVLLWVFKANESLFQTGWFVESVMSASTIVLVVRTRQVFYKSQPGKWLLLATALIVVVVLLLPVSPLARVFGFTPMPPLLYGAIIGIVTGYVAAAEGLKQWFYRTYGK